MSLHKENIPSFFNEVISDATLKNILIVAIKNSL